jgi:hypothetical protein
MKPAPQSQPEAPGSSCCSECKSLNVITAEEGSLDTFVQKPVSKNFGSFSSEHDTSYDELDAAFNPKIDTQNNRQQRYMGVASLNAHPGDDEVSFQALHVNEEFVRQQQELMDQILTNSSKKLEALHISEASFSSFDSDMAFYEGRPCQGKPRFGGEEYHCESTARALSCVSPLTADISDSDDGFLRFINDGSIVEEQRRIMDEIISDRSSPANGSRHSDSRVESPSPHLSYPSLSPFSSTSDCEQSQEALALSRRPRTSQRLQDEISGRIEEADKKSLHTTRSDHEIRRALRHPSSSSQEKKRDDAPCQKDCFVEIYRGKKVHVKGTDHTWKCIAEGKATLVQCPVCLTILQVGLHAKLLYCTTCQEVSPIVLAIDDSSMSDYRLDGKIAIVMQQQEVDVAYRKKMAKNAP